MIRSAPRALLALAAVAAVASPGSVRAQGKGPIVIDINGPRRDLYKIAVPAFVGDPDLGHQIGDIVSGDLSSSSWFKVLDPRSFLANLTAEGTGLVVGDWKNVGAEGVAKGKVTNAGGQLTLECKLYEIGRGDQPVLEKVYKGPASQLRLLAHTWSNEIVRYFTGEDSFFNTQIAFSAPTGAAQKDIFVMDYDGGNARRLTTNGSQNILPAWSPDGGRIAYTSFIRGNPDLFVVSTAGARPKRLSDRPGVNMGAAFSPDGGKIAVTLSQDGNSEIYVLGSDGGIVSRLTNNAFIDSSPAWSPDGGRIAFVSNRYGSPQIWTMGADGGGQSRLTKAGNYNQEPSWCPKCPTSTIAFTARDEKSRFDIFTVDTGSGQLVRLTENQGSNEHPSWAPNGRALVVTSSRGGLWVITADGKQQRQVYKGAASTPVWGPARRW